MGDDTPKRSNQGDEMSGQFDRSIALVRNYSSRIEREYVRPILTNGRVFFGERPITTTFVTIFCSLGLFPVVFFLGLSVFTFTVFVASALGIAIAASTIFILAFFVALVSVLAAAFFLSILLTILALASFIFLRLVVLASMQGRSGVAVWANEMKHYLLYTIKGNQRNEQALTLQDDTFSDSTNDSGILIQPEKPASEDDTLQQKSN
ncbi:hypothetical protein CPB84DRAFT_1760081 [Gymnopilus junonius]|uniref:Promethin n=1 Tax=Gymnopilus junonius TaxID=109634 RepID=A0A9P5NYK1_GYMJU|nr:hypothetical protein CPB84DRAFT_1760081 [Gymnopilus junonius]